MDPEDILEGEEEEDDDEGEEGEGEEEGGKMFPLINGIKISGARIDLQQPTRILLLRKNMTELRRKVARYTHNTVAES